MMEYLLIKDNQTGKTIQFIKQNPDVSGYSCIEGTKIEEYCPKSQLRKRIRSWMRDVNY